MACSSFAEEASVIAHLPAIPGDKVHAGGAAGTGAALSAVSALSGSQDTKVDESTIAHELSEVAGVGSVSKARV